METMNDSTAKAAGAMTPGQQKDCEQGGRRKKHGCLFYVIWLFLAFFVLTMLMEIMTRGNAYKRTWGAIGKREIVVANPRYALSPDRKELVVTCELQTQFFDSGVNPLRPSHVSSRTAETRIPLDPMPDSVVKSFVEVSTDPAAPRARKYPWGARDLSPAEIAAAGSDSEAAKSWLPRFQEFSLLGHKSLFAMRFADRESIPDGLSYSLTIHPDDEPLLSAPFVCHEKFSHMRVLLIPYDRDGDFRVMLSPRNASASPAFLPEIRREHPEVLTTSWDRGFTGFLKCLFWFLLNTIEDMFWFSANWILCLFIFFLI